MTVVLKLGGSLITKKDERETIDTDALEETGRAIGEARLEATDRASGEADIEDLVVVHGGGSFGHQHAEKLGVSSDVGTTNPADIRQIHDAMGRLNKAVLDYLNDHDVGAVPVRPFSAGYRPAEGEVWLATEQIEAMLAEGFVPVLHGDVFTSNNAGATIVSGDELVVTLAQALDASRVGLCASVPGVLDEQGSVVETIESFDDVADALGESDATDVTGGMAAKVRALLALETDASVFDLDGLPEFLAGGDPGTLVRSEQ